MTTYTQGNKMYEGKAKVLFEVEGQPDLSIQYFKDDATAFNGEKKGTIHDKGMLNQCISAQVYRYLEENGIATHYVDSLSDREMVVKRLNMIPLEVVVRNRAAGSLCKRLGLENGQELSPPLFELFYKDDDLGDPLINDDHVRILNAASQDDLVQLRKQALRINELLVTFFDKLNLVLVDYKLEFGKAPDGSIYLGDEFSPDSCRLWDKQSGESMDKDRYRFDMGKVEDAYQTVWSRIQEQAQS